MPACFAQSLSESFMSAVTREAVEAALRQYTDPHLDQDPVSAGCVKQIDIQGDRVAVRLELGYAAGLFRSGLAQLLQMALENLDGVSQASRSEEHTSELQSRPHLVCRLLL